MKSRFGKGLKCALSFVVMFAVMAQVAYALPPLDVDVADWLGDVFAAPQAVYADESGQCGPNAFYSLMPDGTLQIYGSGDVSVRLENVVDANSVNVVIVGDGIAQLRDGVLANLHNARHIQLPPTLRMIGNGAFAYSGFADIILAGGVTEFGAYVFYNCVDLSYVVFPANLTVIPDFTCMGCISLTDVGLPEGLQTIGAGAFKDCAQLREISLPSTLQTINDDAFHGCGLTEIYLPDSVTTIGRSAFGGNLQLSSARLPANLTAISDSLFANALSLKQIDIPNSVQTVGNEAFFNSGLEEIVFPDSVTTIGKETLRYCNDLRSVTLPANLATIPYMLVGDCEALEEVVVPASVTTIGYNAQNFLSGEDDVFANSPNVVVKLYAGSAMQRYCEAYDIAFEIIGDVDDGHTYAAELTPAVKAFATVREGYTDKAWQKFTLTNTGDAPLTGLSASIAYPLPIIDWDGGLHDGGGLFDGNGGLVLEVVEAFDVDELPGDALGVGESVTFYAGPLKSGLPAGEYAATLVVAGDHDVFATSELSFTVKPAFALTPGPEKTFNDAYEGYASKVPQVFTIRNYSGTPLAGLSVALIGYAAEEDSPYQIYDADQIPATIPANGSVTVTVGPKAGLTAEKNAYGSRTYTDTLSVSAYIDDADRAWVSAITELSFTVQPAPPQSATLSPYGGEKKVFSSKREGYSDKVPQKFTVTNTSGAGWITGLRATLGYGTSSPFQISTGLSQTAIAAGKSATLSVGPKSGLTAYYDLGLDAIYSDVLTITGDHIAPITVRLEFTVTVQPANEITLTPGPTKTFNNAAAGYKKKTPQVFTVKNTGGEPQTGLSAVIIDPDSGDANNAPSPSPYFEFKADPALPADSFDPDQSFALTVGPVDSLPAGTYTATLIVSSAQGAVAQCALSFTVDPAA